MSNQQKKKVFVIAPSGSGHINPISGLVHELCKRPDIECIFYGNTEHRELIEKTGAKFRLYSHRNIADAFQNNDHQKKQPNILSLAFNLMMDSSDGLLPQLLRDSSNEKPDLVLYDSCFFPAKYLLNIINRKSPQPMKAVEFYPNIVFSKAMTKDQNVLKFKFSMVFSFIWIFMRQLWLNWKFGMFILNPFSLFTSKSPYPKIISIFPELQPGREDFDSSYNFVGPCVSEQARSFDLKDDPEMKSFIDLFPEKDINTSSNNDSLKFIYMSLGTLYNDHMHIYEKAIKAVEEFDLKPSLHFKSAQLRMIISVGDACFNKLNEKISRGELKLPKNIIFRPKVPQIDILKRADLFITHCGMNSTCETIKYAVPIIAIPLTGDQPINAIRVCDQMSLGVRLDPLNLKVDEFADSIDLVLSNDKFRNNVKELAKVSTKYSGQIEATQVVVDYLKLEDSKKTN